MLFFFLLQGNRGGIIASVLQKYRLQFGGKKQFQTSSFICYVEVSRLRKRDRVQVNVYVNSRDFHCTYNQLFAFLLPTQGFIIRKSWKIKFAGDPPDARGGRALPKLVKLELWCWEMDGRQGTFASWGWFVAVYLLMEMDIAILQVPSPQLCLLSSAATCQGRKESAVLCSKDGTETPVGARSTSLISSEFHLVKNAWFDCFPCMKVDTVAGLTA